MQLLELQHLTAFAIAIVHFPYLASCGKTFFFYNRIHEVYLLKENILSHWPVTDLSEKFLKSTGTAISLNSVGFDTILTLDTATCVLECLKRSQCKYASYNRMNQQCDLNVCPKVDLDESKYSDSYTRSTLNTSYNSNISRYIKLFHIQIQKRFWNTISSR